MNVEIQVSTSDSLSAKFSEAIQSKAQGNDVRLVLPNGHIFRDEIIQEANRGSSQVGSLTVEGNGSTLSGATVRIGDLSGQPSIATVERSNGEVVTGFEITGDRRIIVNGSELTSGWVGLSKGRPTLKIKGEADVTINNLTVQSSPATYDGGNGAIVLEDMSRLVLDGVKSTTNFRDGLLLNLVSNAQLRGLELRENGNDGIRAFLSNDLRFDDCEIVGNGGARISGVTGNKLTRTTNVMFTNCLIRDNKVHGIWADFANTNFRVESCQFRFNTGRSMYGEANLDPVRVKDCTFEGSGQHIGFADSLMESERNTFNGGTAFYGTGVSNSSGRDVDGQPAKPQLRSKSDTFNSDLLIRFDGNDDRFDEFAARSNFVAASGIDPNATLMRRSGYSKWADIVRLFPGSSLAGGGGGEGQLEVRYTTPDGQSVTVRVNSIDSVRIV